MNRYNDLQISGSSVGSVDGEVDGLIDDAAGEVGHAHLFYNHVVIVLAFYSVFQGFNKAKFANGGSILSSSQFSILPQLAQKMKLASKVVKIDSKIIISLPKI